MLSMSNLNLVPLDLQCEIALIKHLTASIYSFRHRHEYLLSPTSAVFFLTFAYEWRSICKLSVCSAPLRGEGTLERTKNPGDAGKIGVGLPLCWNDNWDSKGWGTGVGESKLRSVNCSQCLCTHCLGGLAVACSRLFSFLFLFFFLLALLVVLV